MTDNSVIFGVATLLLGIFLLIYQEIGKLESGERIFAVLAAVLSFVLSVVSVFFNDVPSPEIIFGELNDNGSVEVVLKCYDFSFARIYYCLGDYNDGDYTLYTEPFFISPQDTVHACATFLVKDWKSDVSKDQPKTSAVTIQTAVSLIGRDTVQLERWKESGSVRTETIPLEVPWVDVIDESVARLSISGDDLRSLFQSTGVEAANFVVTINSSRNSSGVVNLSITANGENLDYTFDKMILYLKHEKDNPYTTVAERVQEDDGFEAITDGIIRGSTANEDIIAVPLAGADKVQIVCRNVDGSSFSKWSRDAICFASSHEILNGSGEGGFLPKKFMTRASLVTALYNLRGNPKIDQPVVFYSDVSDGHWYSEAVFWAVSEGIASSVDGSRFGADDFITREQFAVMLWRYAGEPEPPAAASKLAYRDLSDAGKYAQIALAWAASTNIMQGTDGKHLEPKDYVTREAAAVMLMRLCALEANIQVQ